MTVRELINELMYYNVDEEIEFCIGDDEEEIKITQFGPFNDLPYICFKKGE